MSRFLRAIERDIAEKEQSKLSENDLKKWGLTGIDLRPYQLDGVRWLTQCLKTLDGCILGDEMGLGKTCQVISLLIYARGCLHMEGPFMVLCPLAVMNVWIKELKWISPSLRVVCYRGEKKERADLQRSMKEKPFHIVLTNYETCLMDASQLKRWKWKILVVDEAQRLKNENAKLFQVLAEKFSFGFRLLLTGTPVQNSLREVYALLSFIHPGVFPPDAREEFLTKYADVNTQTSMAQELHQVLQPFLLRRLKIEVLSELPKKLEIVVYHGMSALQKSYYKGILKKNLAVFRKGMHNNRLLNTLMNLRKCVSHPYLFDGVEPEPFEIGEHLVEASGKLTLLDSMLAYLKREGHRALVFSQMTRMLDIVQDYLEYRGYSYERLDGSVRAEERSLAINKFKGEDIFIFLLSTRAGGVGLNLEEADTVIFLDSDFNPQNDLQAESRAHRLGQRRPVKVIRMLGKDTVEEIIYSRALSKLHLTNTVIKEGRFSLLPKNQAPAPTELCAILKFGVHNLLSTDEGTVQPVNIEEILGESRHGKWVIDEKHIGPAEDKKNEDEERQNHMYYYDGKDYSKVPSAEDEKRFDLMMMESSAILEDDGKEGRVLRNKGSVLFSGHVATPSRKKRLLTESELEERRQKREERAAKKAKQDEEKKRLCEEHKYQKKMAWWESCGYKSLCLPSAESEDEDMDEDEEEGDVSSVNSTDSDDTAIRYVLGDVTHPQAEREDAIIVHCVDDSGRWGRGGLFTKLELRSDEAKKKYELAGDMEDLDLGNVLLFSIDDKQSRLSGRDFLALIVAQRRDKANQLSGIYLTALDEGLKKIYRAAKQKKASVHLPRIGHATKGFNWYGTERLIRKHLASRGVPTFIYYYKRTDSHSTTMATSPDTAIPSTSHAAFTPPASVSPSSSGTFSPPGPSEEQDESPECSSTSQQSGEASGLADFMNGVCVFFYNLGAAERKKLARYLITYDGDEEDTMSSQVTHIVAEIDCPVHLQELQDMCEQYPQAILVKKKWLESCFANQRKVSASKYVRQFK